MSVEKKSIISNIFPFLPLLVLYIVLIFTFAPDQMEGDELRYFQYATNLTNGFYADGDNPSIRNGPGYPLFISLPVLFKASEDVIRLLNVPLMLMALVFFAKSLSFYLRRKKAILVCYIVGLYPPILKCLVGILSESLSLFLICGFLYFFLKLQRQESWRNRYLIFSAFFLGFLSLTKVIFAYVILSGIVFYMLFYLIKKSRKVQSSLLMLLLSFMFSIPYLGYTYSVTGKAFLWGTHGGEILYWRTTPFENEFGDWKSFDVVLSGKENGTNGESELYMNHGDFIESLVPLTYMERDSRFKAKAIENVKTYPVKYLKNTLASISRLCFNYPHTYTPQKMSSYFYIIPNMFLVISLLLALVLAWINRKNIPDAVWFIILISFIFIGGLSLLDGKVRHLLPSIPLLVFFIALVFQKFIRINNGNQIEVN